MRSGQLSDSSRKHKLEKLYQVRDAKFDEIVSSLYRELYSDLRPATAADRQYIIEEAEELTNNWAVAEADKRRPELSTALQLLLSEHQEICQRIIRVLDTRQSGD
jgi:hypothetical protein